MSLSLTPVSDAPVAAVGPLLRAVHYGRTIPLTPPPVAMSAAHILFGHWDAFPPQVTFGLLPDRAAAIAAYGPTNIGPTRADLHEIRDRMSERFSSSGLTTPKTWEVDWRRATLDALSSAERACYKLGSLSGHWAGSVLVSAHPGLRRRVHLFSSLSTVPVLYRIRRNADTRHSA
jgi:hypothetical protein